MKVLVASDLHLSDRIWKHRPIEGDSYHTWSQICNLAITREVQLVILAGDLLDRQTNLSRPVKELVSGLRKLHEHGIDVFYVQGQHEYQAVPWLSLSYSARWLNQEVMQLTDEWAVLGCDFLHTESLQEFLQGELPKQAEILVMHQVWSDFMGSVGKPQGSFADIPSNIRLLITGDYHEAIIRRFGELTVLSPGSTHLREISEIENKSVFEVELQDGREPRIESLPLTTRRRVDIKISSGQSPETAYVRIQEQLDAAKEYFQSLSKEFVDPIRKPLLRLTYDREDHATIMQIKKELGETVHLFLKPVRYYTPEELEPQLTEHLDVEDRSNLINCLDAEVDAQEKPLVHGLARKLLEAPDKEQALRRWVEEQLS